MKLHSSTSLLSNSSTAGGATWTVMEQLSCNHVENHPSLFCSLTHTPLGLLCSIPCLHLLQWLQNLPTTTFLFALSWTETHQRSAELEDDALLTASLPQRVSVSPFTGHLGQRWQSSGPAVAAVWTQILTGWNKTWTQCFFFCMMRCVQSWNAANKIKQADTNETF